MKKALLLKPMLLLFALIAGMSSVWADETPEVTLDFTTNSEWGFPVGSSNGLTEENSYTAGGYTITLSATTKYYFNNDGYLMIGKSGSTLTLPAFSFDVSKIVVTGNSAASADTKQNIFVGNQAVSTETKGSKTSQTYEIADGYETAGTIYSFKVTSNHNAQITKIEIYKKASGGNSVATPTFNPVAGTYTIAQNVMINCGTADASIFYTTDGTTPTNESIPYTGAVSITKTGTTLKAIAYKEGMNASSVASATYYIKPNAPTITAAGAIVTITGDPGCTFYYTTDGNAPTSSSTEYTAPFNLTNSCTIKAIAYDAYNNASDAASFKFKYFPLNPKNINSGYYEKVTDVSTLENGDAILIVYETDEMAMSTNQKSNNRGEASVTISEDNVIYAPGEDVQKLVLVNQTEEISGVNTNVFYFYTGAGYLYASSNSSNQLKTEETPDNNNNARATITISNGDATILFTGTNGRNWLKYNPNGASEGLFACYASTDTQQKIVQIYKEVAHNESATITASGWNTFSSNYALDLSTIEGGTAYVASNVVEGKVVLTAATGKVPAGTGLMIKGADGYDEFTINVTSGGTTAPTNLLVGLPNGGKVVKAAEGEFNYVFGWTDASNPGFYKIVSDEPELGAGKAYLHTTTALNVVTSTAPFLGLDVDDETTGIVNLNRETITNNQYYTLDGRRVENPTKGLYIVNGKKVVIK